MNAARVLDASKNPANRVGLFYYNPHDKSWSRLRGIKNKHFLLEMPNQDGLRWTSAPLDAAYFADKPFDVLGKYGSFNPF